MPGTVEERIGHNESVIREVNERIRAGQWPGDDPVAFRCECAVLQCNRLVELSIREYETVPSDARWFVLVPGHEIPGVEVIVRSGPGSVVVEKVGAAGRTADVEDPRDPD